jgi:multimeric flavodoxin WrbA
MTKVVIIYDSKSGNTETMAKSIAEGAKAVNGVEVLLKKLGEPFSLRILEDADALILGSPARYGHVTLEMRDFLACLRGAQEAGRLELRGKIGAAFGSYGWDGGVCMERLGIDLGNLGIKVQSPVLAQVPPLPYSALKEKSIKECRNLGRTVAEKALKQ